MPKYDNRRPVAVPITGVVGLYGWQTNVSEEDSAACGHVDASEGGAAPGALVFFGARRPKPPRCRNASSGVSTFYDASEGVPDGWVATRRGLLPALPGISEKSKIVYVDIDAGKYAWNMPLSTYLKVGDDRAGFGIKDLTGGDKAFIGANVIDGTSAGRLGKPPRIRKEMVGEGGVDVISTFCKFPLPTTIPEGWSVVG